MINLKKENIVKKIRAKNMSQVKSKIYLKIILEIKRQKHLIFLMLFVKKLISIMKKKKIGKGNNI